MSNGQINETVQSHVNHMEEKLIYDPMPETPVCKEDEKFDYVLEICVEISVPPEGPVPDPQEHEGYASDVVLVPDEK